MVDLQRKQRVKTDEENKKSGLADRIITRAKPHRRREYWLAVVTLSGIAILSIMIFGVRGKAQPTVFPRPFSPRPDYRLLEIRDVSVSGQKRLAVSVIVKSTSVPDTIRAILDWTLFSVLDDYNRCRRRRVQVVWVYLYEDSLLLSARWRAMAVWVDSRLPASQRPDAARIGGDAVVDGSVEYDFTNPVFNGK